MFPGVKVMVAEDNAINMSIARRFLMKWGIEVKEAYNGKQAVDLFSQHTFDLILNLISPYTRSAAWGRAT